MEKFLPVWAEHQNGTVNVEFDVETANSVKVDPERKKNKGNKCTNPYFALFLP